MAKITAYPLKAVIEATDRFIVADPESLDNHGVAFSVLAQQIVDSVPATPGVATDYVTVWNAGDPQMVFDRNADLVTV